VADMLTEVQNNAQIAWSAAHSDSEFTACTADMYTCMGQTSYSEGSVIYERCMNQTEILKRNLTKCREQEEACQSSTHLHCQAFYAIDKKFGGTYDPEPDWRNHGCDDQFAGSYPDYLQRYVTWLEDWRAKKAVCEGAQLIPCANQTEICEEVEEEYEKITTYCEMVREPIPEGCLSWLHKHSCCSSYDFCWNEAESIKASAESTANRLMPNLKAQWRSLKRIECLLDVLELEGDQTAKLEECIQKTHSTEPLNVAPPTPPVKATCDFGSSPAGENCSNYEDYIR